MKKLLTLLLALAMCFCMFACGEAEDKEDNKAENNEELEELEEKLEELKEELEKAIEDENKEKIEEIKDEIEDIEDEIKEVEKEEEEETAEAPSEISELAAETQNENIVVTEPVVTEPVVTEPVVTEPVDTTPVLAVAEPQVVEDVCEFYLDYVDITDDVLPPSPSSWYSHYEADNDKVYVDICFAYKNTATSSIRADKTMSGKLIYGDKYEYTGFIIIEEENRGDFTYSNITSIDPLSTEYVHYLFEVPAEVETSGLSVKANITFGNNQYKIVVKESDGTSAIETLELGKTSGEVAVSESIVTKNSVFYIDYSNITNDVLPPSPADWYSHYEADNGKVYVDLCFAYKNLAFSNVRADKVISAKLTYAGKYEYTGFSMIEEENRGDFTYSNITSIDPLTTEYVHYLFEVPEEVQTSNESVVINFTVDGNTYSYTVK